MIAAVDADTDRARAELESLVRIPSISADPGHAGDVRDSANAVAALMRESGLNEVRLLTVDGGHPYVVGEWNGAGTELAQQLMKQHRHMRPRAGVVQRE